MSSNSKFQNQKLNQKMNLDLLASELRPVQPIRSWRSWLALMLLCSLILVLLIAKVGLRAGVGQEMEQSGNWISLLGWVSLGLLSGWFSVLSALPGARPAPVLKSGMIVALIILILGLAGESWNTPSSAPFSAQHFIQGGLPCGSTVFLWSLILGVPWIWKLRTMAPVRPDRTAFWVALALSSLSCAALEVHCTSNEGAHILIWHAFAPFLLYWILWNFLSSKLLKW